MIFCYTSSNLFSSILGLGIKSTLHDLLNLRNMYKPASGFVALVDWDLAFEHVPGAARKSKC